MTTAVFFVKRSINSNFTFLKLYLTVISAKVGQIAVQASICEKTAVGVYTWYMTTAVFFVKRSINGNFTYLRISRGADGPLSGPTNPLSSSSSMMEAARL